MGGSVSTGDILKRTWKHESKLEAKVVEAMQRRAVAGSPLKSLNTIILKFPKIDESLRKCWSTFEQFDEDSNGVIDQEELKRCFRKLEISFTDEEINELFKACEIHKDMGMKFKEFVVLLCLVYLLKDDVSAIQSKSRLEMPHLEATFQYVVDAFVFLDKNKDGYVSKSEMVEAINETTSGEHSSRRIAMRRFEEMDWDKNGMVNFKEFLFAFTRWVGIDDIEDEEESKNSD
ncbi:unnamed protein product [Rhodiola kirilowii]